MPPPVALKSPKTEPPAEPTAAELLADRLKTRFRLAGDSALMGELYRELVAFRLRQQQDSDAADSAAGRAPCR